MGMLDRYRKSGGFVQLLMLLETCGPAKQEKFLELIRAENPLWADTIKLKMLDMNRIYSWQDDTLAEIIGTLQDLTLAVAFQGASGQMQTRLKNLMTQARWRKIDDIIQGPPPSPGEIASMHVKIIETVRKMISDGFIRLEKIDPPLQIEEDIEDKLGKSSIPGLSTYSDLVPSSSSLADTAPTKSTSASDSSGNVATSELHRQEVTALRNKVAELARENTTLRQELATARGKLDQIKRIA